MTKNLRSIIQIFPKWHYGQIVKGDTRTSPPWNIRKGLIISVIKTNCWQIFYRLVTLRIFWPLPGKRRWHSTFIIQLQAEPFFKGDGPSDCILAQRGTTSHFSNLLLYWELQPVVGYLRLTLVFVLGSALQQEFPFYFSRVFPSIGKIIL